MVSGSALKKFGRGRIPAGRMNRLEAKYARLLAIRVTAGELVWWQFEAVKLRLADGCFYEPDFLVMLADGVLEIHEVKGVWTDDARVKIKVAAEQFPVFRFAAFRLPKRGRGRKNSLAASLDFEREDFPPWDEQQKPCTAKIAKRSRS